MTKDVTSHLSWYQKPFGRRVESPDHPYFAIADDTDPVDTDVSRRRQLADLAGL